LSIFFSAQPNASFPSAVRRLLFFFFFSFLFVSVHYFLFFPTKEATKE